MNPTKPVAKMRMFFQFCWKFLLENRLLVWNNLLANFKQHHPEIDQIGVEDNVDQRGDKEHGQVGLDRIQVETEWEVVSEENEAESKDHFLFDRASWLQLELVLPDEHPRRDQRDAKQNAFQEKEEREEAFVVRLDSDLERFEVIRKSRALEDSERETQRGVFEIEDIRHEQSSFFASETVWVDQRLFLCDDVAEEGLVIGVEDPVLDREGEVEIGIR